MIVRDLQRYSTDFQSCFEAVASQPSARVGSVCLDLVVVVVVVGVVVCCPRVRSASCSCVVRVLSACGFCVWCGLGGIARVPFACGSATILRMSANILQMSAKVREACLNLEIRRIVGDRASIVSRQLTFLTSIRRMNFPSSASEHQSKGHLYCIMNNARQVCSRDHIGNAAKPWRRCGTFGP